MKQKKPWWGLPLLIVSALVFLALYFGLLKTVFEEYYVTRNLETGVFKQPPLLLWVLVSLVDGFLLALGTCIGFNIDKPRFFGIQYQRFAWKQVWKSKAFWAWVAVAEVLVLLFTLFWRADI